MSAFDNSLVEYFISSFGEEDEIPPPDYRRNDEN